MRTGQSTGSDVGESGRVCGLVGGSGGDGS